MATLFLRENDQTFFVCGEDFWRSDVWADITDPCDVWSSCAAQSPGDAVVSGYTVSDVTASRGCRVHHRRHTAYLAVSHLAFTRFMQSRAVNNPENYISLARKSASRSPPYLQTCPSLFIPTVGTIRSPYTGLDESQVHKEDDLHDNNIYLIAGAGEGGSLSQRRNLKRSELSDNESKAKRRCGSATASSSNNAHLITVIDIPSDSEVELDAAVSSHEGRSCRSRVNNIVTGSEYIVKPEDHIPDCDITGDANLYPNSATPLVSAVGSKTQTQQQVSIEISTPTKLPLGAGIGPMDSPDCPESMITSASHEEHLRYYLSQDPTTPYHERWHTGASSGADLPVVVSAEIPLSLSQCYDTMYLPSTVVSELSPTAPAPWRHTSDYTESMMSIDTPIADMEEQQAEQHLRNTDLDLPNFAVSESGAEMSNNSILAEEKERAVNVKDDETWLMPGKRFGATGVIRSLRALRDNVEDCPESVIVPDLVLQPKSPLQRAEDIVAGILEQSWEGPIQECKGILSILSVAHYLLTDPTVTPSCITTNHHLLCFLLMGTNREDFRAHDGELYICGPDLVYICTKNPGVFDSVYSNYLSALEGLFLEMAIMELPVNPSSIRHRINQLIRAQPSSSESSVIEHCHCVLRRNWDYSKVSTRGKAYSAHAGGKLADIVSRVRRFLTVDLARGSSADVWQMFVKTCQTPKKECCGFSFEDHYVDKLWSIAPRSRSNNCYAKFNYKFHPKDEDCLVDMGLSDHLSELDIFIESAFYNNEAWLFYSLITMILALNDVLTEKIFYICGSGEDSKGLVSLLESGVMGEENSATLDPSVFSSEEEFRKSAHFAVGKKNIVINESRRSNTFLGDLWKRYVVGETCDVRCNFGHTIQAQFLGRKSQQCNFGDLPIIEQHQGGGDDGSGNICNSVYRRILGFFAGKATLTRDPLAVDHKRGVFLKKPGSVMRTFLQHPVTKSLFLTKYLVPFAREYTIAECLALLDAPPPSVVSSTTWVAQRLSGVVKGGIPPIMRNTTSGDNDSEIAKKQADLSTLIELHNKWRNLSVIFDYKMHQETQLGASKKNRPLVFKELISSSMPAAAHLFIETVARNRKGVTQSTFARTLLDLDKYNTLFGDDGIFAPWEDIQLGAVTSVDISEAGEHEERTVPHFTDLVIDETPEIVNIRGLEEWLATNLDRRSDQLTAYIAYVRHRGQLLGDSDSIMVVPQAYRQISAIGRAYCSWLSLQHCTKESRKAALAGLPWKVYELDICNAHPTILMRELNRLVQGAGAKFRLLASYCGNTEVWRRNISAYYGISENSAKSCLLCVLFGGKPIPKGESHALPCVGGLAAEINRAAEYLVADERYRNITKLGKVRNAKNPKFSALSIYLGHLENEVLLHMREQLSQHGLTPISLVFDGIYFAVKGNCILEECVSEIEESVSRKYSLSLKLKDFNGDSITYRRGEGSRIPISARISRISRIDVERRISKPYDGFQDMCILTAMHNIMPLRVICPVANHGPMSYNEAGKIFGVLPISVATIQLAVEGFYLVHYNRHAIGVRVSEDIVTIYDPNAEFAETALAAELVRLLQEDNEVIVFELRSDDIIISDRQLVHSDADLVAGSLTMTTLAISSPVWTADSSGAASAEGESERVFKHRIHRETRFIWMELQKDTRVSLVGRFCNAAGGFEYPCPCCPFRSFPRKSYLVIHFEKCHLRNCDGSPTNIIRRVAQEIHNAEMLRSILLYGSTFRCNLLQQSCLQIIDWVGNQSEEIMTSLSSVSDFSKTLVVLFDGKRGPSYVLKSQLDGAYRLNGQTYFNADFANLLLRFALTTRCKLKGIRDSLMAHFAASGYACVGILMRHTDTYQDLLSAILQFPEFIALKESLVAEATRNGEWEVISHDGTYKVLKSLIGDPSTGNQSAGGCATTLHTIRGRSGAVPGVSLQHCENARTAMLTLTSCLPSTALATCRFLFSDSPSHFARVGDTGPCDWLREVLPNISGIGEDPLHLVFRVEYCVGGSRTHLTSLLLKAQKKFNTGQPTQHIMQWSVSNASNRSLWRNELVSNT